MKKTSWVMIPELGFEMQVEIAETERQRIQGLMFRTVLPLNAGMLFKFDLEELQRVWMKDTVLALDVIFVSARGRIVSIIQNLEPCIKERCRIYESKYKAKYMLEINSGLVDKVGIKLGQQLIFERVK